MTNYHAAQAPIIQGHSRRSCWFVVAGALLMSVLACALSMSLLIPYMQYERTHDTPNPVWGTFTNSYTYTPATASTLNPVLLKTRPDLIVLREIEDYIQFAGTYPCASDLTTYSYSSDPILMRETRICPYKRLVTNVVVTSVYIGTVGPDWGSPGALVRYTVTYADGAHWESQEVLGATQSQLYYLGHIRLTCWSSFVLIDLYSYILPLSRVPSGVRYEVRTPSNIDYRCKP